MNKKKIILKQKPPFCKCGCNQNVLWSKYKLHWNKYIKGHSTKGQKRSRKTKNKIRISLKNRKFSKKRCKNISKGLTGRKIPSKICKKMSIAIRKRFQNPEEHKKLSIAAKKRWENPKERKRIGKSIKKRWQKPGERERMSKARIEKLKDPKELKKISGENNGNWKGGISFEFYSCVFNNQLKESIRKRDNYICQLCNKKQNKRKLDIHHIDYNKKNCNPKNLISLCRSCHAETSYNRKVWVRVFQKIIKNIYSSILELKSGSIKKVKKWERIQ